MDNFKTVTVYSLSCVTENIHETESRMLPAGCIFVSPVIKDQCIYISRYNKNYIFLSY